MKRPRICASHTSPQGFFDLCCDTLERTDGAQQTYTMLSIPVDATTILARDPEGRWILNREYRHPTGKHLLGCPGGRLEKGEDPLVGGQRELFEETGYFAKELILLGSCYPFPGLCNQKIYYLFAPLAEKLGEQALDPFEFIELELKTDAELEKAIRESEEVDAQLCAALWYYAGKR